ncbi:MAG TPA: hypothetical protein HPP83_03700 [Candidatus Hydrogenedentes bacterium]|nr:hypothetical protein [Candidatus Hydrogenedentota bacterium]
MKTKTWIDPIVEEVRKVREELAREADYDVKRLGARLQESQKRHGDKLVTRAPQKLTR